MNIKDLIKQQEEFDSNFKGNFKWNEKINDENIELLNFLLIALMGEVGETSNLIKKVNRGDYKLRDIEEDLSEEIVDILIYTLKMIYQLDIDIEQAYIKKMDKNKERFKKFLKEE